MFFMGYPKYENRSFPSKILCSRRTKQKSKNSYKKEKREAQLNFPCSEYNVKTMQCKFKFKLPSF